MELTWSETVPTVSGFYWCGEPDIHPHVVRLVDFPGHPEAGLQVRATGGGFGSLKNYFATGTRWGGPIALPKEPAT